MELVSNEVNKAEIRLTLKVASQDYRSKLTTKIKKYAQEVRIPGFRAGNTAIIQKRYGSKIALEVIEDMLSKTLNDYIKERRLTLLSDPIFYFNDELQQKISQSKPVAIELLLELVPDFEVALNQDIHVEEYHLTEVKKVDLDAYLDELRHKHSTMVPVEEVIAGDLLDLVWLTSDNKERVLAVPLNPAAVAIIPKWIGSKVGDQLSISYDQLLKITDIVPQELKEVGSKKEEIILKLNHVKRIIVPELDEAMRQTLLKNEGCDPKQDFYAYFTEKMHEELAYRLSQLTKNQIKEQLLSKIAIDVPEGYSKEEQDDIRFMLILEQIAKNASIEIPQHNTDFVLLATLNQTLTRILGKPPKKKELLNYFESIYTPRKKEKHKKKLRLHDLTLEVLPYIKKHISVTQKSISSTEAQKLLAKSNLNVHQA